MSATNSKITGMRIPPEMSPEIRGPFISEQERKRGGKRVFYSIYGGTYFLDDDQILNVIKLRRESNSKEGIEKYLEKIGKKKSAGSARVNSVRAARSAANASAKAAASASAKAAANASSAKAAANASAAFRARTAAERADTSPIENLTAGLSGLCLGSVPVPAGPLLDKIEAFIIGKYQPGKEDIMNDRKNGNIADFFIDDTPANLLKDKPINEYKKSLGLEDFAVVGNSGGGHNDCLVISFLMGISPAYRRLSYSNKYSMATDFRMNHLVKLIKADRRTTELKPGVEAYINSSRMLDDSVIPFLANLFKINILQLEKYKEGLMEGVKGLQRQPPSATLVTNPKYISEGHYPSGIIIINIGNSHYEIVRKNPNKYVFSFDELNVLFNKVNDSPLLQYAPEGGVSHGFQVNSIVYVKGSGDKQFRVTERRFKNGTQNIEYYNLTNGIRASPNNVGTEPFVNGAVISPWNCPACTFENPGSATVCGVCGNPRPPRAGGKRTRRRRKTSRRHR